MPGDRSKGTSKLTVAEVAERLCCSSHSVTRMIRDGRLRAVRRKGSRSWLVEEADLADCLEGPVIPPHERPQQQASREHEEAMRRLRERGIG